MMLPAMEQIEPFESNINIIVCVLIFLNLLKRHLSKLINPSYHGKLQRVFLNLDFLLRVDTFSELLLQHEIPIYFFHSGSNLTASTSTEATGADVEAARTHVLGLTEEAVGNSACGVKKRTEKEDFDGIS
ncbi:hypothetical protein V6N13_004549 [Hibiscus sabdariffa]